LKLEQLADHEVRVSGCRGSSPPSTHKVCINTKGKYKSGIEVLLTGLNIERKAELYIDQIFYNLGGQAQVTSLSAEPSAQVVTIPSSRKFPVFAMLATPSLKLLLMAVLLSVNIKIPAV
jgi:hypothetical protein